MYEKNRRKKLYNGSDEEKQEFKKLPFIFCIIDEYPDFIRHDSKRQKELESMMLSLLEGSNRLKIRFILAAQDPTEQKMKCGMTNLGTCLAFKFRKENNSKVMIGESGAEKLPGKGNFIFKHANRTGLKHIRGAFIDEDDIPVELERILIKRNELFPNEGKYKYEMNKTLVPKTLTASENDMVNLYENYTSDKTESVMMAELIMLLFKKKEISGMDIEKELGKSNNYRKSKPYIDELDNKYHLLKPKNGNRPRKLKHIDFNNISPDVLDLLITHGYTKEDVEKLLIK